MGSASNAVSVLARLDDQGVVMDANTEQDYKMILQYEKENRDQVDLAFDVQVNLNKFSRCFDGELARFLTRVTGTPLAATEFDESTLEPHLRLRLRREARECQHSQHGKQGFLIHSQRASSLLLNSSSLRR